MRTQVITIAAIGVVAGLAVLGFSGQEPSQALYGKAPDMDLFHSFIVTHGKSYSSQAEFSLRFGQFKRNLAFVSTFASSEPSATFTLGLNKFADYTPEEYRKLLGYKRVPKNSNGLFFKADPTKEIPASVDWRTEGAVTPVKDQGQCGSCWAFSTTGSLEGRDFIATGVLNNYSEQQLVDCDRVTGYCEGCDGGDMYTAMQYSKENPLQLEADYPYTGEDGKCHYDAKLGKSSNLGASYVNPNSTTDLKAAIAEGPVSVAIEADSIFFQLYSGGVFNSKYCGLNLDHGVLAVGYGTDAKGGDYYIVKNSWSSGWGDNGFIKIAAQSGPGMCGIQMEPVYPTTNKTPQ